MLLSARLRRTALTAVGTAILLSGCSDARATQQPEPDRSTPAATVPTTPAAAVPTTPAATHSGGPVVPPIVGGRPVE